MSGGLDILPEYVSRKTLARLLDMSVRTVDDYCAAEIIPKPVTFGSLKRWHWPSVKEKIDPPENDALNILDPFDEGAKRVGSKKAANDCAA